MVNIYRSLSSVVACVLTNHLLTNWTVMCEMIFTDLFPPPPTRLLPSSLLHLKKLISTFIFT